MPQIPNTYGRRPTPRFGAPDQAAPVVTPGEIYQGRALQSFSKDMTNFFLREQAKQERISLEGKTIEYKRQVQELEQKYKQMQGAQVAEDEKFFENFSQEHQAIKDQVLGTVKNANVHTALSQRMDLGEINFKEGLTNHLVREREIYGQQVYEGSIALYQDEMGAKWNDDSAVMQARDKIEHETRMFGRDRGLPKETIEALVKENLTKGHLNVIMGMVDAGRYDEAKKYFRGDGKGLKGFKDEISSDKHDDINRIIKSAEKEIRAQELSDFAFLKYEDDMQAGLDWIRNNASPEDRKEALSLLKVRYAENEFFEKQAKVDASDEFWKIYNAAIDTDLQPLDAFYAVPRFIRDGMDQKALAAARNAAEKAAQGQSIHTQFEAWDEIYSLATGTKEQQEEFKNINLNEYVDRISTTDLKAFKGMQEKEEDLLLASTMNDIKLKLAEDTGLNKLEASTRLDEELIGFQERNGKKATKDDARQIANSLAGEILFKRNLPVTMGKPIYPRSLIGNFTDKVFEAEIEGIPSEEIDEYFREIQRLKALEGDDSPITEQEIIYLYNKINKNSKTRKLSKEEIAEIEG